MQTARAIRKKKRIKKKNQSSNHFANIVHFNFALFTHYLCMFVCVSVCVHGKVWRRTGTLVFKLDGPSRGRTHGEAKRKHSANYKRGLSRCAFNKDTQSKYKYSSRHAPLKTGSAAGLGLEVLSRRCLTRSKFDMQDDVGLD